MIAKASTIPHGANAIRYSVNKDRADIVKANLLPDDISRGNFNSYHVSAKRSALVDFLGKHLLHEHHPTVHRFR